MNKIVTSSIIVILLDQYYEGQALVEEPRLEFEIIDEPQPMAACLTIAIDRLARFGGKR